MSPFANPPELVEGHGSLAYHDRLMHAVTIGAAALVQAESLDVAIPQALRVLGEALGVDRVTVVRANPAPALIDVWQRPDALPVVDKSSFTAALTDMTGWSAWWARMNDGNPLMVDRATSEGAAHALFVRLGVESLLTVPILVKSEVWGCLGIESCAALRRWTLPEVEILKIFGDIAGSLIMHHEAAGALQAALERFRAVTTTAHDGIIAIGITGLVELWNPAAERILGYTEAEAIGRAVSDFVAPRSRPDFERTIASFDVADTVAADGKTTEIVAQRKDGTEVAIEISFAGSRRGIGWGGVGIIRDVTERKASEAKLVFANTLLKSGMDGSRNGIVVVDPELKVVIFNRRFADMWKIPPEHLAGVTLTGLFALLQPLVKDPQRFLDGLNQLPDVGDRDDREEYSLTDGRIINRDILRLFGPDGSYLGRVGYFHDVTEERNAAKKLQFANLLLKTQMEASLDGILIINAGMKIVAFNQRFSDIWQIPMVNLQMGDEAPGMASGLTNVKDEAAFSAGVAHLFAHPGESFHDELELTDGRCIERDAIPLTAGGSYLGRAWFMRDITERKQATAYALKMARHDALTGLASRAVFVDALQHAIAATKRGDKNFAVIYLDLDHFKDVNDTLGHPAGDELLKQVARRLTTNMRETDTVARFGGDEFAVLVSNMNDPANAATVAQKLIAALAVPFPVGESEIHSGASIGIATFGADAADAETLLSHADVALYRAKAEGRGGYRFFTEAMDKEVQSRVKLGGELRRAIDTGELFLMYQPQVEIASGQIKRVEALVRWQHPERGVLTPGLFIAIAEQIGIIARLDRWVLWTACRQARLWLDAGLAPVQIAVNVSALQFQASNALEADVAAALRETGLPPHLLELEVTETVLMSVTREHDEVLRRLRAIGVSIAIDDFGTGYSSLSYLRRFATNRIKIAQVFVNGLETRHDDAAIIRATIGLARELGIDVIAEGVETAAQAKLIAGWGCKDAQGFLFSRPLCTDAATAALQAGFVPYRMPS
jgi:diguanylate cyclase (GGDEF)-like protein/PAS domain S-box-containing protein